MLRARRLATLCLVLGFTLPAAAEGIKFGTDFDAGAEQAKRDNKLILIHFTQKASPTCAKMIKEVFSNAEIGQTTAKKFVSLRMAIEQEKGARVFQQFGVRTTPTVLILDPQGVELVEGNYLDAAGFAAFLETAINVNSALDALAKVKKDSPAGLSAALKKIAATTSKRSKKVLVEHAENENLPESVRRIALDGVTKQKDPAGDLVPFLGGKSQAMRAIAFNALKTLGPAAMPALLDGLDGFSPDQRASCFTLAYPHTKTAKIAKDAAFWRTGKAETREAAVKAWKEWWEKHMDDVKN